MNPGPGLSSHGLGKAALKKFARNICINGQNQEIGLFFTHKSDRR